MKHDSCMLTRREFMVEVGLAAAVLPLWAAAKPPNSAAPAEQLHPALYFDRLDDKTVRCRLCPRNCTVPDGGYGFCRIRHNRGGNYCTLVYGKPIVLNPNDPIEKKPFFHVYPGSTAFSLATIGCNFECKFCQNWDISQAPLSKNPASFTSPADIARKAKDAKAKVVAYTYSEPIIFYEYMADCARAAKENGIENVMVSNGFVSPDPLKALFPLMTAIKIDLKGFTPSFYQDVCNGYLEPVLATLKALAGSGVWFEIVVLVIPTLNDGDDELKRMTEWIVKELGPDVPVHFSRFHPEYRLRNLPPTPLKTVQRAREIAIGQGCRYVYLGNVPGDEGQNTHCHSCKTLLVKRVGYFVAENNIANGLCPKCKARIPGLWA